MPVQQPIPVWFGAASAPAYRRVGRLADGWFPQVPPDDRLTEARSIVDEAATEAGRDPSTIGVEGRVSWTADGGVEKVVRQVLKWNDAGATHLTINTMGAGLGAVDGHLAALAEVAEALDLG
jgi:pyruvate dehydrogenase complex dehydrogenase (E1) component